MRFDGVLCQVFATQSFFGSVPKEALSTVGKPWPVWHPRVARSLGSVLWRSLECLKKGSGRRPKRDHPQTQKLRAQPGHCADKRDCLKENQGWNPIICAETRTFVQRLPPLDQGDGGDRILLPDEPRDRCGDRYDPSRGFNDRLRQAMGCCLHSHR